MIIDFFFNRGPDCNFAVSHMIGCQKIAVFVCLFIIILGLVYYIF